MSYKLLAIAANTNLEKFTENMRQIIEDTRYIIKHIDGTENIVLCAAINVDHDDIRILCSFSLRPIDLIGNHNWPNGWDEIEQKLLSRKKNTIRQYALNANRVGKLILRLMLIINYQTKLI